MMTKGFIMAVRNPDLIDALQATLKQIQESGVYDPHDQTYQRLKRSILLTIADLEARAREREDAAAA